MKEPMNPADSFFLTHYYSRSAPPFRSVSELPDEEAVRIMEGLYEPSPYGERFRDPAGYLAQRRRTENWVRTEFTRKGHRPEDAHPIYMVFGRSRWIEANGPLDKAGESISIPLDLFDLHDVSFTYPDSMLSLWIFSEKPAALYREGLNGVVFDKEEILKIVLDKGHPENWPDTNLPPHLAPYLEAQVWNRGKVLDYLAGRNGR
jgi:hypothetical protein